MSGASSCVSCVVSSCAFFLRKSQVAGPDGQGAVCRGLTFHRPFKRIEVMDENHLVWLVYYIHNNPRKHGVLQDFTHYAWSSYASLLSQSQTSLARELVFDLFAGRENFIAFHQGGAAGTTEHGHFDIEE